VVKVEYKNLNDLMNGIQSAIDKTLENEVFEEVKETELRHIKTDVYGVYKPKEYVRRYGSAGMLDPNNIVIMDELGNNSVTKGNLSVVNITAPNSHTPDGETSINKDLPELIEYGHDDYLNRYPFVKGYDYAGGKNTTFLEPRPFTANTIDELQTTKAHIVALKNGLSAKGFNVK
jgi:hypothetical protein